MRILYIHDQKKIRTGAHQFNNMIVTELKKHGHSVDTVYPRESINLFSPILKGVNGILFFYSLIQKRKDIYKYDIIQGTTYTPLAFIDSGVPVVAHFGSTTFGFLKSVPSLKKMDEENKELVRIYQELKKIGVIETLNPSTRAIKDINEIEIYVAKKSAMVVATSEGVRGELVARGVPEEKIIVIHNAIEDYWFNTEISPKAKAKADIVYLGRMGDDAFTIKLKGINRLIYTFEKFPDLKKIIVGMSGKKTAEFQNFFAKIPNLSCYFNIKKKLIPRVLKNHFGDIYVNPGRYEGFCLSLIETMSQGLVPVTFPIGVAPEIIKNGHNGYLVNTVEDMAEKIDYLKNKMTLRNKMAREAINTSKLFQPKIIIPKFIDLYTKLHHHHVYGGLMAFAENYKKETRPDSEQKQ